MRRQYMIHIQRSKPLAPLTTFHVGGRADFFVEAFGTLELAEAFEFAEKNKLSAIVLGGGSNILFSDTGFAGMVIKMNDCSLGVSGEKIISGAGTKLVDIVARAKEASLTGIEKLAGIPGSCGGAVRGNAGAFGLEIGNLITSVKVLSRDTGMMKEYSNAECVFAYRTSIFKEDPNLVVLSIEIHLQLGNKSTIERNILETIAKREAKHPQFVQCAGSFFMNPIVIDAKLREEFTKDTGLVPKDDKLPAGWTIDHVGLRGKHIGGAKISSDNPNYLINTGNATAEDIIMLASLIKQRVRDTLHIQLKEEVQFIGF